MFRVSRDLHNSGWSAASRTSARDIELLYEVVPVPSHPHDLPVSCILKLGGGSFETQFSRWLAAPVTYSTTDRRPSFKPL